MWTDWRIREHEEKLIEIFWGTWRKKNEWMNDKKWTKTQRRVGHHPSYQPMYNNTSRMRGGRERVRKGIWKNNIQKLP